MSDIYKRVVRFDTSPQFDPFTRIVVKRSDVEEFISGDESGRTLTITCPWGTQRIADGLLLQIQGYAYQPFEATGAIVNPAAELGDGIRVNGIESRLFSQNISFGPLCISDISAPDGEELDHEFPYFSSQERKTHREISIVKNGQSSLDARVAAIEKFLQNVSKLTAQLDDTTSINYLGWEESEDG